MWWERLWWCVTDASETVSQTNTVEMVSLPAADDYKSYNLYGHPEHNAHYQDDYRGSNVSHPLYFSHPPQMSPSGKCKQLCFIPRPLSKSEEYQVLEIVPISHCQSANCNQAYSSITKITVTIPSMAYWDNGLVPPNSISTHRFGRCLNR